MLDTVSHASSFKLFLPHPLGISNMYIVYLYLENTTYSVSLLFTVSITFTDIVLLNDYLSDMLECTYLV